MVWRGHSRRAPTAWPSGAGWSTWPTSRRSGRSGHETWPSPCGGPGRSCSGKAAPATRHPFFAEALRIGTNGLAAAPGDAEWTEAVQSAWIDAGEGWLAEGRIDEARQGFERALDFARRRIDLDPADAEQRTALLSVAGSIARLWEKSGRLSDAATHWTRVAEWFGRQADAASDAKVRGGLRQARGKAEWELGALYEAADRPDHAREALRAGALLQAEVLDDLALSPGVRVSELGNLSFHLVKAGEFDRARQAAESALAISPDSLWIIQNLGHARMFLGEYDAARDLNRRHARVANVATGNRPLSWAAAARGDFAAFRRLRICTPEVEAVMKEIEALLPPTDSAP
jgi:tetratricopeptide (TPR) repeat protein